ncbi:hypothetical protein [Nitrosococcus halophilus]|uniref:hypothetical protein n=1 Tax=Nitrosococcus halophilus TaxID=133539 RepID=UPI00193D132D|nr:hypothetical protein [Nitrosococcus halophilus]
MQIVLCLLGCRRQAVGGRHEHQPATVALTVGPTRVLVIENGALVAAQGTVHGRSFLHGWVTVSCNL